jgi:hypothetical protein
LSAIFSKQATDNANDLELKQLQTSPRPINSALWHCSTCPLQHNCHRMMNTKHCPTSAGAMIASDSAIAAAATSTSNNGVVGVSSNTSYAVPTTSGGNKNIPMITDRPNISTFESSSHASMVDPYGSIDPQPNERPIDDRQLLSPNMYQAAQFDFNENKIDFVSMQSCNGWLFKHASINGNDPDANALVVRISQ